jgi:hypothetical protein
MFESHGGSQIPEQLHATCPEAEEISDGSKPLHCRNSGQGYALEKRPVDGYRIELDQGSGLHEAPIR